jgi:hypothetical protein
MFVNNFIYILLFVFIGFLGVTFPLIFMYTMPDSNSSPFSGAIFLLAISLVILSLLYSNKKVENKIKVYCSVSLSFIMIICAFFYALISLYSLGEVSYPIASSIYFLDSFLIISGLIVFKSSRYEN